LSPGFEESSEFKLPDIIFPPGKSLKGRSGSTLITITISNSSSISDNAHCILDEGTSFMLSTPRIYFGSSAENQRMNANRVATASSLDREGEDVQDLEIAASSRIDPTLLVSLLSSIFSLGSLDHSNLLYDGLRYTEMILRSVRRSIKEYRKEREELKKKKRAL
jgi:hypothetical protein